MFSELRERTFAVSRSYAFYSTRFMPSPKVYFAILEKRNDVPRVERMLFLWIEAFKGLLCDVV
jgi:hypothetical protein